MKRRRGAEEQLAALQESLDQYVQKKSELEDKLRETEDELATLAPNRTRSMVRTHSCRLSASTDPL